MYKKIHIIDDNYEFYYSDIKYEIDIISPEIEILRYIEYNRIKNKIIKECKTYNLISKKRSIKDTINSIVSREIFSFFSQKQEKYIDSFFPFIYLTDDEYNNYLYDTFNYSFKFNKNIKNFIKNINLKNEFKNSIKTLREYKIKNLVLFDVIEKKNYYLFKSRLQNTFLNFKILKNIYLKLEKDYIIYKKNNNHIYELNYLIYCLLLRYNTLNSLGHQWGIPLKIKDDISKTFNANFECFASSFNHYYKYYCSIFYDIEKYFMSMGYFENIIYIKGFYLANPPYDNKLLYNMVDIFIKSLENNNKQLIFFIGLPNYKDVNFSEKIKNSKYFLHEKIFGDADILWYDFMNNTYEKIPSSLRYTISNNFTQKEYIKNNIEKIINNWINFKQNI